MIDLVVTGYDVNMNNPVVLDPINVQWNRRYYDVGDFEIQLLMSDYRSSIRYVMISGRNELGQVQKVQTKHEVKGDFVLISGHFLEEYYNMARIVNFSADNQQPAAIVGTAITKALNDQTASVAIAGYTGYIDSSFPYGTATSVKWDNESYGETCRELLKTQEMAFRVPIDTQRRRIGLQIWRGNDRSSTAVFNEDSPWVLSLAITRDETAYTNLCILIKGTDEQPTYELRWRAGGVPYNQQVRAFFLDTRGDTEKTADELNQQIKEEFENNDTVYDADVKVVQGQGLDYLTGYDLGDKCSVTDSRVGLNLTARIVEVREVWKAGKHDVSLVFGNPKKRIMGGWFFPWFHW